MLATVLHAPGDIRYEDVAEPKILRPTDATSSCRPVASAAQISGPFVISSGRDQGDAGR